MKKNLLFALACVIAFALSACSSQPNEKDQKLDEFEAVVDSFVVVTQQIDKTDMGALVEYMAMAQRISDQAQEIGGMDLSAKQANRFLEISKKMESAATEFSKDAE